MSFRKCFFFSLDFRAKLSFVVSIMMVWWLYFRRIRDAFYSNHRSSPTIVSAVRAKIGAETVDRTLQLGGVGSRS